MFVISLDFMIEMAYNIKSMPIMHNNKMHKALLQVNKLIYSYIKNDLMDINDSEMRNESVRIIIDLMKMQTFLTLNRNSEISKFFIEEVST